MDKTLNIENIPGDLMKNLRIHAAKEGKTNRQVIIDFLKTL